ncbi:MAG: hypothetical protein IJY20_01730 [Clostridia bacterium]|nr:hypothetical protein [Clostridia bacterium]
MFAMQKMIDKLVSELEAERVENARFRRMMEDILYNLEEDNMPTVSTRIREDEKSLGLLVEDGNVRGNVLVEAINGTSAVTIGADKIDLDGSLIVDKINDTTSVSIKADKIELDGKLIVDTINETSDVTINADKILLDADRINLDGKVIINKINDTSDVTIKADKIDLGGKVIIDKINEASNVTIKADKINLNGAVTANENFVIAEDGSVACRALSVTGGNILLPDPGDGSAVLRVESEDEGGGVTIFADRIAFDGSLTDGWEQEASLTLEQLMMKNKVSADAYNATAECTYLRPGNLRLTRTDTENGATGEQEEAVYGARGIMIPYLYKEAEAKTSDMLPLYIDAYGRICAVR